MMRENPPKERKFTIYVSLEGRMTEQEIRRELSSFNNRQIGRARAEITWIKEW